MIPSEKRIPNSINYIGEGGYNSSGHIFWVRVTLGIKHGWIWYWNTEEQQVFEKYFKI